MITKINKNMNIRASFSILSLTTTQVRQQVTVQVNPTSLVVMKNIYYGIALPYLYPLFSRLSSKQQI